MSMRRPTDPPHPRLAATLPARPERPLRLETEYKRVGALHLFAAFDTRTGQACARAERRKRQAEFIALLTQLDREIPPSIRRIEVVLDNSSVPLFARALFLDEPGGAMV